MCLQNQKKLQRHLCRFRCHFQFWIKYPELFLCIVLVIIKFFVEICRTLIYLLLQVKSLTHTRSAPTMSSCSDNYIPYLIVDNYTVTSIAKRKQ